MGSRCVGRDNQELLSSVNISLTRECADSVKGDAHNGWQKTKRVRSVPTEQLEDECRLEVFPPSRLAWRRRQQRRWPAITTAIAGSMGSRGTSGQRRVLLCKGRRRLSLVAVGRRLEAAGFATRLGASGVSSIPCNTSHASTSAEITCKT